MKNNEHILKIALATVIALIFQGCTSTEDVTDTDLHPIQLKAVVGTKTRAVDGIQTESLYEGNTLGAFISSSTSHSPIASNIK